MSRQAVRRNGSRRSTRGGDGPEGLPPTSRAQVEALIKCTLCREIFREVHTINECLHSFCLECLERQWGWRKDESRAQQRAGNRGCPTCNIALGPQPFLSVINDRKLQAIADKIAAQLSFCHILRQGNSMSATDSS